MTRLFCVMIAVVAAGFLAAPAWASIPYPPNCTVTWVNAIDDSAIGICPAGDYSSLTVTVRDQFNAPMAGVTVTAVFSNALAVPKVPPNMGSGVTNGIGVATVLLKGGTNNPGGLLAMTSTITVKCLAVTLATYSRYVYSPDYNASQTVNAGDFGSFADDWLRVMLDCHSDFHRGNPQTQAIDFGVFASHWLHF